MSYRIEQLISDTGRCKVWRSFYGLAKFTRNKAVATAAQLNRKEHGRIRIRKNRMPKGGNTK